MSEQSKFKSRKVVLEITKVEKELITQAIQEAIGLSLRTGWPASQRILRLNKLNAILSHIEDSWENSK